MANFKELLGDKFKDDMSAADLLTSLNGLDLSQTEEFSKLKTAVSNANTEAAKFKKELAAKLTDDELSTQKQQELADKMAEIQKENSQMKLKESFISNGYDAKTAADLATAYSEGDMGKFATLNAKFMETTKTALQATIKEQLLKDTPGLQGGGKSAEDGEQSIGEKAAQAYNQQFAPAPAATRAQTN